MCVELQAPFRTKQSSKLQWKDETLQASLLWILNSTPNLVGENNKKHFIDIKEFPCSMFCLIKKCAINK